MAAETITRKLDLIENEITSLKSMVIKLIEQKPKHLLQLKGALGSMSVKEEEIQEAKKSLFNIGI